MSNENEIQNSASHLLRHLRGHALQIPQDVLEAARARDPLAPVPDISLTRASLADVDDEVLLDWLLQILSSHPRISQAEGTWILMRDPYSCKPFVSIGAGGEEDVHWMQLDRWGRASCWRPSE